MQNYKAAALFEVGEYLWEMGGTGKVVHKELWMPADQPDMMFVTLTVEFRNGKTKDVSSDVDYHHYVAEGYPEENDEAVEVQEPTEVGEDMTQWIDEMSVLHVMIKDV